jgi:hypothetical protein
MTQQVTTRDTSDDTEAGLLNLPPTTPQTRAAIAAHTRT